MTKQAIPTKCTRAIVCSALLCLATVACLNVGVPVPTSWRCRPERAPQDKAPPPEYDFRTRPYAPEEGAIAGYDVVWHSGVHATETTRTDAEAGATTTSWTMRAGAKATAIVFGPSPLRATEIPRLECPGGRITERLHAVLEGPAVVAPVDFIELDTRSIFHLIAYDPGVYNLHIEVISGCVRSNNNTVAPVVGSPFRVHVTGSPPRFPKTRCSDYRYRHGRWLECHNTPLPCMRSGWVWVNSECYSYLYSPNEVIHAPETWVVFAGSSVQRGSFLALVDHLLGPRAANLTTSEFWKCWGWSKLIPFEGVIRFDTAHDWSARFFYRGVVKSCICNYHHPRVCCLPLQFCSRPKNANKTKNHNQPKQWT